MKTKLINSDGQRTFAVVLDTDDDVVGCLRDFAMREGIEAAQITAIGALRRAVLGYFDWEKKDYRRIPVDQQVEVVSLIGDVALGPDRRPSLHIHAVLGRSDGIALGGHLLEGRVRPTLEVILIESPAHLQRQTDEETGLALIRLETAGA